MRPIRLSGRVAEATSRGRGRDPWGSAPNPAGALPLDPGFFPSGMEGEAHRRPTFSRRPTTFADRSLVMHDQMMELFRVALGLAEPWVVSKIEFSAEQRRLDLWVDFPAGSRFACPECGREGCGAYDSAERTWRHLNFFEHKTHLHARQPRIECPEHGIKTVAVPWARPGSGFTLLLEAFILVLVQGGMTAAQAAKLLDIHDTRLWRIVHHYVGAAPPPGGHSPGENPRNRGDPPPRGAK